MTAAQVEENLLERDLVMYMKFAERHMLPGRRAQLQMARVAQYVHGDTTKPLSYYDIASKVEFAADDETADDFGSVFAAVSGGNVYVLGQGRKKKAVK